MCKNNVSPNVSGDAQAVQFSDALLAHYDTNARQLPWRTAPAQREAGSHPDPYHVWLSEIMLQQTTVAAVIPYFEKFTRRWPTVRDLATADEQDVMAAWAGLGYYARARNLVACANEVAFKRQGVFPNDEADLLSLPGVGAYTAAAISAIAFDRRAVVVDANVERVVSRVFAIKQTLPAAKKTIRMFADRLTPAQNSGDFAQAMMDLGATICTARNPRCTVCPVSAFCKARTEGDPARYPIKAPKKARPERTGRAFWVERDGKVWLLRREGKGMLGGLRALPDDRWSARKDGDGTPPFAGEWRIIDQTVRHIFTHFALTLELAVYDGTNFDMVANENLSRDGVFWPIEDLEHAGLPTLFVKAAQLIVDKKGEFDGDETGPR